MNKTGSTNKIQVGAKRVSMSHGSGGKDMGDLIEDVFIGTFGQAKAGVLEDQAQLALAAITTRGDRLAFTTDSYVVHPLFFPGGNIGTLAVNGTVNDLAVGGAIPLYLSCSMIIEEGFSIDELREIVTSMKAAADKSGILIVTGDTKVVEKRAADKLFINTSGIGVIPKTVDVSIANAKPGDVIIINGSIGEHGAAIVSARGDLALDNEIESDCQPLASLIAEMLDVCPQIRSMRDATRGGVASVLNELAQSSKIAVRLTESAIPIREDVRGLCEILGLDPLYLANEGKVIAVVPKDAADAVLSRMRSHEYGKSAAIIGEVLAAPAGAVIMQTTFGGQRMIDKLVGEQLPRIC